MSSGNNQGDNKLLHADAGHSMYHFQSVHLELTTACNFRCPFCPLVELQRPQAKLPLELAESVLKQCAEDHLTDHAHFHVMGEALLHPQLMDILALCNNLGIKATVVTNGALYREDKYRALYTRLDTLQISYRTVDDMETQTVQKKLTHAEYLDKILECMQLRAAMPESRTRIRVNLFINDKTVPSINQLCHLLSQRMGTNGELSRIVESGIPGQHETFSVLPWLSFMCDKQLDWRKTGKHYPSHFGNCSEFEIGFAVLASGEVTACCWDAHGGTAMGNVANARLKDILYSEKAEAFRRSFRRHVCPTETCRNCLARRGLARSVAYQAMALVNLR